MWANLLKRLWGETTCFPCESDKDIANLSLKTETGKVAIYSTRLRVTIDHDDWFLEPNHLKTSSMKQTSFEDIQHTIWAKESISFLKEGIKNVYKLCKESYRQQETGFLSCVDHRGAKTFIWRNTNNQHPRQGKSKKLLWERVTRYQYTNDNFTKNMQVESRC